MVKYNSELFVSKNLYNTKYKESAMNSNLSNVISKCLRRDENTYNPAKTDKTIKLNQYNFNI